MPLDGRDVRLIVPILRRRLDPGVGSASAASGYTDDMLKDVAADAAGELIAIGGEAFPYTLTVASADAQGFPVEFYVEPEPTYPIQQLIAIQGAINQISTELRGLRSSERITSHAGTWSYDKDTIFLRDRLKALLAARDAAMRVAITDTRIIDRFSDLLVARAPDIATEIGP